MHVEREAQEDEEERKKKWKRKGEKLNSRWRYLMFKLSVLDGVVSSVLSSLVVLCFLRCDWLHDDSVVVRVIYFDQLVHQQWMLMGECVA